MKALSTLAVAAILFAIIGFGMGYITQATAGNDDDWLYDPDPAIEQIWQEVNRLQVEADKIDKKIEMAHRLRASPDLRKRLAQVALGEAREVLNGKRAVLSSMMQQVK